MAPALLVSVFIIATCGLVYELVAGTLASYLLGDSVTQFSTVIGVYLFSMGIGSYMSKFVKRDPVAVFVNVELLVGFVGGFSATILFLLFNYVESFRIPLYGLVGLVGILVGLEIPLMMRILQDELDFKDLVARVLTFDYVGALLASLLFPLVLVPGLGLMRSGLLFGMLNTAIAIWSVRIFRLSGVRAQVVITTAVLILLAQGVTFYYADRLLLFSETGTYPGTIFHAETTPYQRIILTNQHGTVRLFLNGNLQFSSKDEYRYHEALVHPGLAALPTARRVLILGGGDGLAIREVLRYPNVDSILLVDLDTRVTELFRSQPLLRGLNQNAFDSPKVRVENADAFIWLRANTRQYDFIIVDLPDPSNFSLGKLYSLTFYQELARALAPTGSVVVQSTSPFVARKAYWCVEATLRAAGLQTQPYHTFVPSFGEWGYLLAGHRTPPVPTTAPEGLRYFTPTLFAEMRTFPLDMAPTPVDVNRLNNQALVNYFEEEWGAID